MATRQRSKSDEWDLSAGSDFDYSGNEQISDGLKLQRDQQIVFDNALILDKKAALQQGEIALASAKNADQLDEYTAKSELEQAMSAADGYTDQQTPSTKEITGYQDVYLEENGGVSKPYAELTPEQKDRAKAEGQVVPVYKETAAQLTRRPRTQIERLREALPQLKSQRARAIAQDAIRKEITNQAYQLHAYEPDKALQLLRDNGMGVSTNLKRGDDGNFKQVLSDGREIRLDAPSAAAMVGDIIKGTNDAQKMMEARVIAAQKQKVDNEKSARDFNEKLILQRDQQAAQFQRAQLNAQARIQAGRYGRRVELDEEGNVVAGAALGGGSGTGRVGKPVSSDNVVTGSTNKQPAKNTTIDSSKLTDQQLKDGLKALKPILTSGGSQIERSNAKAKHDELSAALENRNKNNIATTKIKKNNGGEPIDGKGYEVNNDLKSAYSKLMADKKLHQKKYVTTSRHNLNP